MDKFVCVECKKLISANEEHSIGDCMRYLKEINADLLAACEAADRFLAILKVTHPHLVGADVVDTLQAAIQKAKA